MGQSQPSGHHVPNALDRQLSHQQHPTFAAFARSADFTDPAGSKLLTEVGFVQLFNCQLPQPLIRAIWLEAVRPDRKFVTEQELAKLHDRLEAAVGASGGNGDSQRMLLRALLSMAEAELRNPDDNCSALADAVLDCAWLSRRWQQTADGRVSEPAKPPDCLRQAVARLLKPPQPPSSAANDHEADEDEGFDAKAEVTRLVGRHMPQLLSEAIAGVLACLRSPLPLSPASLAASAASPQLPADVLEPWLGWTLACQLPPVFLSGFSTAQLLYDTNRELRSPSQLSQLVFDYAGPTLLLAEEANNGRLFCCAADCGYREAWQPYGEADCRLTQLAPELKVLLTGPGLVYANLKASVGIRGVAMGRSGSPVLLIGAELDTLTVFGVPSRLGRLRAIGLGDAGLVEKLRLERERDQRFAAAARDRKLRLVQEGTAGWDQNVDRQLLEWGGVKNAGNNAQAIEGREAELGTGSRESNDGGPSRLLKPEF